ncbi:MAG: hypothetical protein WBL61_24945, partial [Bryobacteraceae bacterium]
LNLEPKTKKGDRPLRGRPLTFQDHLVLETESDFRIILRLENAWRRIPPPRACVSPANFSPSSTESPPRAFPFERFL